MNITPEQSNCLAPFSIKLGSAIIGKFLASAVVWALALALTFPMILTVNYLGSPDPWTIFSGYLGKLPRLPYLPRNHDACLLVHTRPSSGSDRLSRDMLSSDDDWLGTCHQ